MVSHLPLRKCSCCFSLPLLSMLSLARSAALAHCLCPASSALAFRRFQHQIANGKTVTRVRVPQHAVLELIECGVELHGCEIKAARLGSVSLTGAWVARGGARETELFLYGSSFSLPPALAAASRGVAAAYEPARPRRLLVRRRTIDSLLKTAESGEKELVRAPSDICARSRWAHHLQLARSGGA